MATFDSFYSYDKNFGLKVCPFNPNHKVKDAKYAKHVFKCEQMFPKNALKVSSNTISSSDSITSIPSMTDTNTDDIQSLTQSIKDMNCWDESSSIVSNRMIDELVVKMDHNWEDSEDESGYHTKRQSENSPRSTSTLCTDCCAQNQTLDELTEGILTTTNDSEANKLMPKQVITSQESDKVEAKQTVVTNGSGDADNWICDAKPFTLFDESVNYDNLTEEQVMEMAESFVDAVVLARMTKNQKFRLNLKLIEVRKAEKTRKLKAFQELVALRDQLDSQIKDIPTEIRRPYVDVRQMFKLQNKFNDTKLASKTIDSVPQIDKSNTLPSISESISTQLIDLSDQKTATETLVLSTICNCCSKSLSLCEENIKRLTVFCDKCSGIKFGGYFECQECKLYGYYARSQIDEHMAKHFPKS